MSTDNQTSRALTGGADSWALRLLQRILSELKIGSLTMTLSDGQRLEFAGEQPGPHGEIEVRSFHVLRKALLRGDIGFGESYMDGDWDSPNLPALLETLVRNQQALDYRQQGGWRARLAHSLVQALRRNSRRGSRRNIAYHYDLGNEFYALWLDQTLAYSSAVFTRPEQDLAEAQREKFRLMYERLQLRPEHQLLEIGSGWGGFALYAAERSGCRVTSITLSAEQLAEARRRAQAAGLADRVRFELRDYRDLAGQYDRVVSIEMYEAVGERYWPQYFRSLAQSLKPGGRAAIQGITIDHAVFPEYRRSMDFIQKYIFPGGILASPEVFCAQARSAGLGIGQPEFFGQDYAATLHEWHRRVWQQRERIVHMFDERFLRMWRYYLAYCEVGFRIGRIDLMQVTLHKS